MEVDPAYNYELDCESEESSTVFPSLNNQEYKHSSNGEGASLHSDSLEKFPVELLSEIFIHCLPPRSLKLSIMDAPFLLTRVCRRWYEIVSSMPLMWSRIFLDPRQFTHPLCDDAKRSGTEYLALCSTRSRNVLVEIYTRVEFLSHRETFDVLQRLSHRITLLRIFYPPSAATPNAETQYWDVHLPEPGSDLQLSTPRLQTLEITARCTVNMISEDDMFYLRHILLSSNKLKAYVLGSKYFPRQMRSPLITENMTNLTFLSILEPVSVHFLLFILQTIPALVKLALLKIVVNPDNEIQESDYLDDSTLKSALSVDGLIRPFTHTNLQNLAVKHLKAPLSLFFELATLPNLVHLVLEYPSDNETTWPHSLFMNFLRRSDCRLKNLQFVEEPIIPKELVEILGSPTVVGTLECAIFQKLKWDGIIIDDEVLRFLTLPESNLDEAKGVVLPCPNLEILSFFVSLDSFSTDHLVTMLESRLASQPMVLHGSGKNKSKRSVTTTKLGYKTIKKIEMDWSPEIESKVVELRERGLVTKLYPKGEYVPMKMEKQQKDLLDIYMKKGMSEDTYDNVHGKWREPNEIP